MQKEKIKVKDPVFNFMLYRFIVIFILIAAIFSIKFIFPNHFKEVKKFYNDCFSVDITASELLEIGEDSSNEI